MGGGICEEFSQYLRCFILGTCGTPFFHLAPTTPLRSCFFGVFNEASLVVVGSAALGPGKMVALLDR